MGNPFADCRDIRPVFPATQPSSRDARRGLPRQAIRCPQLFCSCASPENPSKIGPVGAREPRCGSSCAGARAVLLLFPSRLSARGGRKTGERVAFSAVEKETFPVLAAYKYIAGSGAGFPRSEIG